MTSQTKLEVFMDDFSGMLFNLELNYNLECELYFTKLSNNDEGVLIEVRKEDLEEQYVKPFKDDLADLGNEVSFNHNLSNYFIELTEKEGYYQYVVAFD